MVDWFPLLVWQCEMVLLLLKLRQMLQLQLFLDSTAKVAHSSRLFNHILPSVVLHSLRLRLPKTDLICQACFLVVCLQIGEGLEFAKFRMYRIN